MHCRKGADQDRLQRDSAAPWRVADPGDGCGPAIVCQGSDERGCQEKYLKHVVRPWLNEWQFSLLTVFELDHVIERAVLTQWVSDSMRTAAEDWAPGRAFVVQPEVVFKYLCTPSNLRVAFRHPCHDRRRHDATEPRESPVKVH